MERPTITQQGAAFGLDPVARACVHDERRTVDANLEGQPIRRVDQFRDGFPFSLVEDAVNQRSWTSPGIGLVECAPRAQITVADGEQGLEVREPFRLEGRFRDLPEVFLTHVAIFDLARAAMPVQVRRIT